MTYATEWASALADVTEAGASITFTGATTVAGVAIRTKGNPQKYAALKLIESEAPTLFFVPATYGDTPDLNALATFGGTEYAVVSVEPVAPDGVAIAAHVIVGR